MLKNILKKSFADISASFLIILVCFIFASFFPTFMEYTAAQRLFFYDLLVRVILGLSIIASLGIFSHHFIMHSDYFPISKSVRRGISVLVVIFLTAFVNLSVFAVLPKNYVLIGIALIVILGATGMIVGFILEDKTQKRDIEVINKRLNEIKDRVNEKA